MPSGPLRVLLSHTGDFGERPSRDNSYIGAAFRALDRAEAVVTDMSLLPASACSPKQVSEALAKDADLYVGIIGWRYGSPVREDPDVSYTQLEFRTAAEAGVPRLVFLLSEDQRSRDESDPNADRQRAFRKEITESGITVQRFGSPEQLSELLFLSVYKPRGWDPAFLRLFLDAADAAAARGTRLPEKPGHAVFLSARDITSSGNGDSRVDPLERAEKADRLVVLGGPGAGKSWLAREAARNAAQSAIALLANREPPAHLEVPLLVPIAPFFSLAEAAPSVWDALVTQAVKELEPFLPNHGCVQRARRVLEPGEDRYFIVLEGLDEAAQLQTTAARRLFEPLLRGNCRVMVTSRPERWRGQIDMTPPDTGKRRLACDILELAPLAPDQVRRIVRGAARDSHQADATLHYLEAHPSLQEATKVPLVAHLVGIAGPADSIRDVYDRALNQILRGDWRSTEHSDDLGPYRAARSLLVQWAWQSAIEQNDPVSGLANWTDDVAVNAPDSDPAVRAAINNVFPLVPQDPTSLTDRRRFLHRSIREHLVTTHVASLSVEEAAVALEPHLWFDDTWHAIIPAAVAAHRDPAALLRRLLLGDAAPTGDVMTAFRARDGLGELGDMVERLYRAGDSSIGTRDPVLEPIVRACCQERKISLEPDAGGRPTPGRDEVAQWVRKGELPMRDAIAAQIRGAAFSAAERSALAEGVAKRLVGDRLLSTRGTLLWRHHLAIALEALDPDPATLAAARSGLTAMLGDARRMHEADQIVASILRLRPTESDRQTVARFAVAALNSVEDAWHLVDLTQSLMAITLTVAQQTEMRDALRGAIEREPTSTWKRQLLRAYASTEPTAGEIARCVASMLSSASYRKLDSHDRQATVAELRKLTAGSADQDGLLREIALLFRVVSITGERRDLVADIARRSTPAARVRVAQELGELILRDEKSVYSCLELLPLLKASVSQRQRVVERLLQLLDAPDAPWATIGQEIARLDPTESQRLAAADRLLSVLVQEPDLAVKLRAADTLAVLRPDSHRRKQALSILRAEAHQWAGWQFGDVIATLRALHPGPTLDADDLTLVLELLETHRSDGTSLGFTWARTLVGAVPPDSETRTRFVAATLVPAARLEQVGFISFNDRLIDAGTLAGEDPEPKRLVGEAYIEVLRAGVARLDDGQPWLEPHDIEVIVHQVSGLGLARDQQGVLETLIDRLSPNAIVAPETAEGVDDIDALRRLVSAGDVPAPVLKAAAANVRRSVSLAQWKAILPELRRVD